MKNKEIKNMLVDEKCEVKEYGKIYVTYNYDLFKNIKVNRVVNRSNYAKLYKSFKKQQLITLVMVNEKYEIIDGQHRAIICKELGLPIYFYIVPSYGVKQLSMAQVSSSWVNKDFLHQYAENNQEDYIWFDEFISENGMSINNAQKIISLITKDTLNKIRYSFENGDFKINTDTRIEMEKFIVALKDFDFFECYTRGSFVSAFLELYFYGSYDHEVMKNKLKSRKHILTKQINKDAYLELMTEEIYSFKSSNNKIFYNSKIKAFYAL